MTIDISIRTAAAGSEEQLDRALEALTAEVRTRSNIALLVNGPSFFTMPEPDTQRVVVSITGWNGAAPTAIEAFNNALPSGVALKAHGTVELDEAAAASLLEHVRASGAMEVAIRTPHEGQEDAFHRERERFFGLVRKQSGFVFDQELPATQGTARAVLIGWKDQGPFMQALGILGQAPEMASFFGTIDVHAYQAFDPS